MNVFDLWGKISLDSSGYEKGLSAAKSAISGFAKFSVTALTAATGAVTAVAASSVKVGANFDKSMSQVAATMGKTISEMEKETGSVDLAWGKFTGNLIEYAKEMGKNTAFSASQAADALNYMALAGYDTQTSMGMLPNVLNLAAAGNMDLARASDMVTDTQTAFGISLERTTQLVNEMAKAASTGNTSVEQLGDAFLVVGGLAQDLNGGVITLADGTTATVDGVQELEIALTAMANAGIKGSEAGTHMRNMLLKLSSPSSDGAKQLDAMNVSVFDMTGKMRSLSDIFSDFSEKMATMTQQEKLQAISDLFNARDIASAEALLAAVSQDWDNIGASILEAKGSAEQMAETQLDNLAGDTVKFKSALEGAQIIISDKLTPKLRKFVQFGTTGLSKVTDAFDEKGLSGAMGSFGQLLSDGLQMVIDMMPEVVGAGMQLLGALGQGIIDNLPTILNSGMEIVKQLTQGIVDGLPELAKEIPTILMTIVDALVDNMPFFLEQLPTIITALTDGIIGLLDKLPDLLNAAMKILEMLGNALIDNAPLIAESLMKIIEKSLEFITNPENNIKFLEAGLKIIISVATALLAAVPKLLEGIGRIIGKVIDNIVKTDWSEMGRKLIDNIGQALQNASKKLSEWWDKWSQEIAKWAVIAWDSVVETWSNVGKWFADRWDDIVKAFQGAGEWISGVFSDAWDGITQVWGEAGKWFAGCWEGIKFVFTSVGETIGGFFSDAWDNITSVWNGAGNFFSGIWDNIKAAFRFVKDWLAEQFQSAWDSVVNLFRAGGDIFEGIGKSFGDIFKSVVNGLISGINWVISKPFEGLNAILRALRDINIFGLGKPFGFIHEIPVPEIPQLEKGGVLKKGQIALLEGKGDEAVIPLSQNTQWIDKVAEKLSGKQNKQPQYIININIDKMGNMQEQDIEDFAEKLMEIIAQKAVREEYVLVT